MVLLGRLWESLCFICMDVFYVMGFWCFVDVFVLLRWLSVVTRCNLTGTTMYFQCGRPCVALQKSHLTKCFLYFGCMGMAMEVVGAYFISEKQQEYYNNIKTDVLTII